MLNLGFQAALGIFVHLLSLILTWWAIQSLKFEAFLRFPKSLQARTFLILLTIAISYLVAKFFLDYLNWSLNLPQLYH